MKPSAKTRALALLDRLDERKETATMRKGADAMSATAIVGAFDTFAGSIERRWAPFSEGNFDARVAAGQLRILRRMLADHALCCRMAALRQRYQR